MYVSVMKWGGGDKPPPFFFTCFPCWRNSGSTLLGVRPGLAQGSDIFT
jgi:hypothetical protein